jgi:hypothetical protein
MSYVYWCTPAPAWQYLTGNWRCSRRRRTRVSPHTTDCNGEILTVDLLRFMSGGRCSTLSWVAITSAVRSCVGCGRVNYGRWRCSSSSATSDEVDGVATAWPWGKFQKKNPQSLGLVACDGLVHRLKKYPCMQRWSPIFRYCGSLPLSLVLPWWRWMMMLEDVSTRNKVSKGGIVILLVGFFVQSFLISIIVLYGMVATCVLCNHIV